MRQLSLAALAAAVLLGLPATSHAQASWHLRQLSTSPPRSVKVMAWIPHKQVIWWFGRGNSGSEVWEFDGSTWSMLPVTGPVPATWAGAYDTARRRLVVSSGTETWEFDGTAWAKIAAVAVPTPARGGFSMVYDEARGEVLLCGGDYWDNTYGIRTYTSDLWGWDGTTWRQRSPRTASGRSWSAMAYDRDRQVVILHGGWYTVPYYFAGQQTAFEVGDTWEWDGTSWTQIASAGQLKGMSMAYDPLRQRVIRFSGSYSCGYACGGYSDYTSEYDGTQWVSAPSNGPAARNDSAMAYDEARQRIVMTGGFGSGATGMTDTWEWYSPAPAAFSTFGSGCVSSGGTPFIELEAGQLPWIDETFTLRANNLPAAGPTVVFVGLSNTSWGVTPLPALLNAIGAPGCSVLASGDIVLPVTNQGGTATWAALVPNVPALAGVVLYNQFLAIDPPANRLGLVVSDAAAGTIGIK